MTDQQGTPDQLPAEKGQGGAGATYKVPDLTTGTFLLNKLKKTTGLWTASFNCSTCPCVAAGGF